MRRGTRVPRIRRRWTVVSERRMPVYHVYGVSGVNFSLIREKILKDPSPISDDTYALWTPLEAWHSQGSLDLRKPEMPQTPGPLSAPRFLVYLFQLRRMFHGNGPLEPEIENACANRSRNRAQPRICVYTPTGQAVYVFYGTPRSPCTYKGSESFDR